MPWQQIINEVMNQRDALGFTTRATNSKTPQKCTHTHTHTLYKNNKQQERDGNIYIKKYKLSIYIYILLFNRQQGVKLCLHLLTLNCFCACM